MKNRKHRLFAITAFFLTILATLLCTNSTQTFADTSFSVNVGEELSLSISSSNDMEVSWTIENPELLALNRTGKSSVVVGSYREYTYSADFQGLAEGTTTVSVLGNGVLLSSVTVIVEPGTTPAPTASPTPTPTSSPIPTDSPTPSETPLPLFEIDEDGQLLSYNGSDTEVVIPDGVKSISDTAFDNVRSTLTSITIPGSVTHVSGFEECINLQEVNLSEGSKYIDSCAFANCKNLTAIDIPYGATYINGTAFLNCTSLTKITIPKTVTSIDGLSLKKIPNLVIYGHPGTEAQDCATRHNIPFSLLSVIYGDVSLMGYVNSEDALLVLKSVVKLTTLDEFQQKAADVNGDNSISADDALLILKKVVRLISSFPVEQ